MSLTDKDKEIITNTWALVRKDITQAGIELFKRFFEENPDYVKFFPFGDLNTVEEVLKDTRLKTHAGRVMSALSSIVDNLNNPSNFEQHLREIISTHAERKIELIQFLNLKKSLVKFLIDKLGSDVMNEEAMSAWSKAYAVILDAYEHRN